MESKQFSPPTSYKEIGREFCLSTFYRELRVQKSTLLFPSKYFYTMCAEQKIIILPSNFLQPYEWRIWKQTSQRFFLFSVGGREGDLLLLFPSGGEVHSSLCGKQKIRVTHTLLSKEFKEGTMRCTKIHLRIGSLLLPLLQRDEYRILHPSQARLYLPPRFKQRTLPFHLPQQVES